MRIVVIAAHADDFIYGTAGTLMTHAADERHLIVLAPTQHGAMRAVADRIGLGLTSFDAPYRQMSDHTDTLRAQLTERLASLMPDYVFAPPAEGDWSPDHALAGRMALDSCIAAGVFGSWNARFLRYPIPATTTRFTPNFWVEVDPALLDLKTELATRMTAGAEDIWPADVVEWEIRSGHRFAHDVGWPTKHAEGFDALWAVPVKRLPPRDDSLQALDEVHRAKIRRLTQGEDLSAGAPARTSG